MVIAADGRSVTVHAPAPAEVAVTTVYGTAVTLALSHTSQRGELSTPPEPEWTVELAEQILRRAKPTGSVVPARFD